MQTLALIISDSKLNTFLLIFKIHFLYYYGPSGKTLLNIYRPS